MQQESVEKIKLIPVVVVDGSTDNTYTMLSSEFPSVHVLKGPGNWWWTKSINEGIKESLKKYNPDYFLLFNDDSQVKTDYLKCLLDSLETAGKDAIIGSISVTDTFPHKISFSGVKQINWLSLKNKSYYPVFEDLENVPSSGLFPTYALNGRGTLISAEAIIALDFLNEKSFPQYGSDDDLALRAWKKGYKVLLSYSCKIYDRTKETSKGTAFRQDNIWVFIKSFFSWNSVNYIPKQLAFFYQHGIKILLPFYLAKFILGTSYAYFFKYRRLKHEL